MIFGVSFIVAELVYREIHVLLNKFIIYVKIENVAESNLVSTIELHMRCHTCFVISVLEGLWKMAYSHLLFNLEILRHDKLICP